MLIEWFLSIKSLPSLLFGVLCLPGDQSHPFAQPTINPLACCICWAGLLGRAVFPPWNEGPNSGSYTDEFSMTLENLSHHSEIIVNHFWMMVYIVHHWENPSWPVLPSILGIDFNFFGWTEAAVVDLQLKVIYIKHLKRKYYHHIDKRDWQDTRDQSKWC